MFGDFATVAQDDKQFSGGLGYAPAGARMASSAAVRSLARDCWAS
jgi:hypothetical protein